MAAERRFSLKWLLGVVSLAGVWFGVLAWSAGWGIALAILAAQLYLRVRWHRFSSWRLGWKFSLGSILTTFILGSLASSGVYGMVYAAVLMAVVRHNHVRSINSDISPDLEQIPRLAAWASALIMLESFVVFSLRKHSDPI